MNQDSIFSIDRLIEFGMGMAVANQMVSSMNQAMQGMHVPGVSNNPMPQLPKQMYYAIIDNNQAGPFSEEELTRLITSKKINKDTFIWKPGMKDWVKAETLPDVLRLVALAPPAFNP